MVIPPSIHDEIIRQASEAFPEEMCGILAARDGVAQKAYAIKNVSESPVIFKMDSQEQLAAMLDLEDQGWELGAIYHSHPRTPAYPSQTDVQLAFYPEALTIIISLADRARPTMRAFRIEDGEIGEETIELVAGA